VAAVAIGLTGSVHQSVGLKTDGNFPIFSCSVFYILPPCFRIIGKSGIRTRSGMEVVGIRTEVESRISLELFCI
jgi:hypothetical protein